MKKLFRWVDKTGREAPINNITLNQIKDNWDLTQEDDYSDETLEDFIDRCYIDDVWETHDEKLICTKIL